ncbi:hypothetical protein [Brevundimonas sp. R86498]|uniref:hypothetical protein n=1 Tax=Brevundimonas sp. R86498 TaxID=3093845 RepID=UPI0037C9C3D9
MSDPVDDPSEAATAGGPPGETPAQKALRLKQARLDARPKPPRGGRFQREQAAGVTPGANRPWTHK